MEFKPFVPELCPDLLRVLQNDKSKEKLVTEKVLITLGIICGSLEEHLHLILPPIVKTFDDGEVPLKVRKLAVSTLTTFADNMSIAAYAPRIIHAWLRTVSEPEMRDHLLPLLYRLMEQMGHKFLVFRVPVEVALQRYCRAGLSDYSYEERIHAIENNTITQQFAQKSVVVKSRRPTNIVYDATADRRQHRMNPEVLKRAWSVTQVGSKEDWTQWLINLRVLLLRQSPDSALRACGQLAELHEPLARDLFNAAFMSVWTELQEEYQNNITDALHDALTTSHHAEIIQTILNLAEFMDHSEKGPLPIKYDVLSDSAEQTRAYAKALRYKELQIHKDGGLDKADCESLITLSNKLNLQEEAAGIVEYADQRKIKVSTQGRWYEKLHQWEKALEMYEMEEQKQQSKGAEKDAIVLRRLRCLEALGEWGRLSNIAKDSWPVITEQTAKQKLAVLAAKGAWGISDWSAMQEYVNEINRNNQDGVFLRGVLAVRNEDFKTARACVDKVRDMLDSDLTSMASESYERAYGAMVVVQQLSELEEAIQFKLMPDRRFRIAVTWWRRLQGCRENVEDWQRTLQVRSLVLQADEMRPVWTKFASLCRRHEKTGFLGMARRVLCMLLGITRSSPNFANLAGAALPNAEKPDVAFAVCKHLWHETKKEEALSKLSELVGVLHRPQAAAAATTSPPHALLQQQQLAMIDAEYRHLTAKCFVKLGQWTELAKLHDGTATADSSGSAAAPLQQAMAYYKTATDYDANWYKAWHSLASCNFKAVLHYKSELDKVAKVPLSATMSPAAAQASPGGIAPSTAAVLPQQQQQQHQLVTVPPALHHSHSTVGTFEQSAGVVMHTAHGATTAAAPVMQIRLQQPGLGAPPPLLHSQSMPVAGPAIVSPKQQLESAMVQYTQRAVRCFFRAINLASSSRLQDTLRLLTLWFEHGQHMEVYNELKDGLQTVPVEIWLEVIPQLIARIDTPRHWVARLIRDQVAEIGKVHPQALVYPLTVAAKSPNKARSHTANLLLQQMSEGRGTLVNQAKMVSDELIRVAILWHELWHEGLDEASRAYFQDKNIKGMFEILEPLHNMIEQGPATLKEQSFNQTYYSDLLDARKFCISFQKTQNTKDLTQAWDLYYAVFKRITQQLRSLTSLDLNYVSPKLLMAKDLELCVPGTYDTKKELVRIVSIHTHLQVITSKQRPRKVTIRGSDGYDYVFLLKGHEDPRQDERVMQLFGLVNTLLLQESDTCRRNLTIQRYSIVPLSQNSGLIGWVPNCDTLHALIRDYRDKKKVMLSIEHKLMQNMAPDLDQLTLIQKVEVFEHALENTKGDDLQQILWLKSPSSEVWFDRRTNYTRSLACMSMVGYILGLGDRHPSNLMLDRISGKVVHIDFGDCFEVAMTREKFPEKIPFRLTRMLINAMEVTGIEGNFRLTCQRVMRVLRENQESLLAVLEAFVYDPLINWRLLDLGGTRRTHPPEMLGSQTGLDHHHHVTSGVDPLTLDTATGYGAIGQQLPPRLDCPTDFAQTEITSKKAVAVIERIRSKLTGRDFASYERNTNKLIECNVNEQVKRLIEQATSHENLCQCYIGWCPFW